MDQSKVHQDVDSVRKFLLDQYINKKNMSMHNTPTLTILNKVMPVLWEIRSTLVGKKFQFSFIILLMID